MNPTALPVEQAWIVGCSRCANEGVAYVSELATALGELTSAGWTYEYPRTFCPQCNDEMRP